MHTLSRTTIFFDADRNGILFHTNKKTKPKKLHELPETYSDSVLCGHVTRNSSNMAKTISVAIMIRSCIFRSEFGF